MIIRIASQAKWEADGVNYFHMNLVNLVEDDPKFNELLKILNDKDLNTFWRFYFDKEDLIYSSRLFNVLDEPMKNKSMLVFKTLKKERIKENGTEHKPYKYQIFDNDGYSNLRKNANATSDIIAKLKDGEIVEIFDNTGDWWFIQSKSGKIGFVHTSRIQVKK